MFEVKDLNKQASKEGVLLLQSLSGWNNQHLMSKYHIPHLRKNISSNITPMLLLDNFSVREADEVINALSDNKIRYLHLIPNCTPIIQPLDVGVNAIFKRIIMAKHLNWMISNFDQVVYRKLNSDQKIYRSASYDSIVTWIFLGLKE